MTPRKKPIKEIDALDDPAVRREMAWGSLSLFFDLYYFDHRTKEPAPFHYEMFSICEDQNLRLAVVSGFRESGKSTIMSESCAIWSILGKPQKKFVLILGETTQKARHTLANIRDKLVESGLLKEDIGPFKQLPDQWTLDTIVIPKFGARIMIGSVGQSLRGFKHKQYRPDLVIVDDIEDIESVKTVEGRDKPWEWFLREVMPGGTDNTKFIVLGNMLHPDSFIKRLERKIISDEMDGIYREYPFLDAGGRALWPERFPDQASIDRKHKEAGDELVWLSEYLLKIVDRKDQLFKMESIRRYDEMPINKNYYLFTIVAVDPAVKEKETADFTAIVAGSVFRTDSGACEIYIHPQIVNERLSFGAIVERAERLSDSLKKYSRAKIIVEGVGSQDYISQQIKADGYPVESISIHGDKRERLAPSAAKMEAGKIFLPNDPRCEPLIWQLVGFPSESHDDLADALSLLVNYVLQYESENRPFKVAPPEPIKTFVPYPSNGFPQGNKINGYWI